jgi:hypothetical protein
MTPTSTILLKYPELPIQASVFKLLATQWESLAHDGELNNIGKILGGENNCQ